MKKNTGDLITVENTLLERTDNILTDVITIRDNVLNRLASDSSLIQVDTDINQMKSILDTIDGWLHYENSDGDFKGIYDLLDDVRFNQVNIDSLRFHSRSVSLESIGGNKRYSAGTVFYFGTNRFVSLRSDCITISVGSEFLLLGDMSEYNNGTVKRLDGVKFAQSDVTKIVS